LLALQTGSSCVDNRIVTGVTGALNDAPRLRQIVKLLASAETDTFQRKGPARYRASIFRSDEREK